MDRIPPHNLEYETSILAGCMMFSDQLEDAVDVLDYTDFYRTAHQNIFRAMIFLRNRKEPVDAKTVFVCLEKQDLADESGGALYLSKLLDENLPSDVSHYTRKVKELSLVRSLIEKSCRIMDQCYAPNDFGSVLDYAQAEIMGIDGGDQDTFISMKELTVQSVERYEELAKGGGQAGIKTGYVEIDSLTGGGFRGSKLIIIGARPRIGKTAFMLNMARNMAKESRRVGIFSIEMDKEDLDDRLFAMETGLNTIRFSTGYGPGHDDWEKIISAAGRKSEWKIVIDDTGGLKIGELKRRCRKMKKGGVEIIFIDQLSRITGGKGRSEYEQRSSIVGQLADLKKELRMPIVLLAQINRKLEQRANKMPTLGDLKSTGSLEEDADIIFLGHREFEYTREVDDKHKAVWDLAKQRGGPTRSIEMRWTPRTTTFDSIEA